MRNNTIRTTHSNGLEVRTSSRHYSDRPSIGRVYAESDLGHEPEPTGPLCRDMNCGSATCQVQRERHATYWCEVNHQIWNRWRRAALKAQKARILPALAEHFGVRPDQIKLRFSKHAGCSMCPCSPGWIIDGAGAWNVDTWVSTSTKLAPASNLAFNLGSIAREVAGMVRV